MLLISGRVEVVKPLLIAGAIYAVAIPFTACDSAASNDNSGKLTVAVAFYPIEEIVRRVGGSDVEVSTLVAPGNEPHEFEPTPRQVTRLENADAVFFLGSDFQPSLEKVITALPDSVHKIDLLQELMLLNVDDGVDPHVWLDPRNMQSMVWKVASVLSLERPGLADAFASNATAYADELGVLHDELTAGLADCAVAVLITTHEAFAYFAQAYGLTQIAIAGISPGDEPSAKQLETIAQLADDNDVSTVFFEENLPPDLARTVADEIGADTSSLGTAETLTKNQLEAGESYASIMRANLRALRTGLSCA